MVDTSKMPWKDTGPVEERKKFIKDWLAGGRRDVAGLSRTYGISRQTEHKWVQRFMEGGLEGLADRSHARRDRAGRVPAEMERRLAAARRAHPTWGPKKLRAWLAQAEPGTEWPTESTIGEVLRRAGLTQPRKRPQRAARRGGRSERCLDDRLQGAVPDRGRAVAVPADGDGRAQPLPAGLPERLRSDNGSLFASTGAGRLSKLAAWWLKLGIELERIRPGKPQQNGRHERMHRVLKAETARPPAAAGALRPLPRRVQPSAAARSAGPAPASGILRALGPGIPGTRAGPGVPAVLGAAPGAPGRLAEVPRAAAPSQRGAGLVSGRLGRGRGGAVADLVLRLQGGRAGRRPREALGRWLRRTSPCGHPSRLGGC